MSRLTELDKNALTRWREWYGSAGHLAWSRKYGWTLFLLLAVVSLVYAITFGMRYPGHSAPIVYFEAGVLFGVSGCLFFARNRW